MSAPKPYKTYEQQRDILAERGMDVHDERTALDVLQRVGYYTLSGYSYPFRLKSPAGSRSNRFRPGTTLAKVESLWAFDNKLRTSTFALNVVRNICAHHARFFNRYYALTPKLPRAERCADLASLEPQKSSTYGMLGTLQYLGMRMRGASTTLLSATLRHFPADSGLTIGATGAPDGWERHPLWCLQTDDPGRN